MSRCEGIRQVIGIDEDLVIPDKGKTIYEDAIACWRGRPCANGRKSWWRTPYPQVRFPDPYAVSRADAGAETAVVARQPIFHGLDEFFACIDSERRKISSA